MKLLEFLELTERKRDYTEMFGQVRNAILSTRKAYYAAIVQEVMEMYAEDDPKYMPRNEEEAEAMYAEALDYANDHMEYVERYGFMDMHNHKAPYGQLDRMPFDEWLDWHIRVARRFRRQDRIIWYLRWLRLEAVNYLIEKHIEKELRGVWVKGPMLDENSAPWLYRLRDKYMRENRTSNVPRVSEGMATEYQHWFSMPIQEIENFQFDRQHPEAVEERFRELEYAWQEEQEKRIATGYLSNEKAAPGTTLVEYPDGSQWADLNRPHCEVYGTEMGHCGNTAAYEPDDTSLVYRLAAPEGSLTSDWDEAHWMPKLFFVLHSNGMLGEMKGNKNQKPSAKYHDVIVDLLKRPFEETGIRGIEGGGYKPENNFSLDDLSDEHRRMLAGDERYASA